MRKLLLTTAILVFTTGNALEAVAVRSNLPMSAPTGNWYTVAGPTGHCAPSPFTPESFKAAVVKEPGSDPVVVVDRSDPKGDGGVVELAVKNLYSGTVNGMVFVNDAARCESIARLIAASHMLPSQIRDAIKNAPR